MFRKKSDFDNRIKLINNSGSDLYISIHLNYLEDGSYFGPQVFYKKNDVKLATLLQKNLNTFANSTRSIKLMPDDTYMYKQLEIPGVLIECGFLSNASDRNKLQNAEYQLKLSKTIANSLVLYFSKQK